MSEEDFDPHIVVRMPRLAMEDWQGGLEKLWQNPVFRMGLEISSKDLKEAMDKQGGEYALFSDRLKESIWKYGNRMCHRSTPFGGCSAMGILEWAKDTSVHIDGASFRTLALLQEIQKKPCAPYPNPLSYPFGQGVRFYHKENRGMGWKIKEIEELPEDLLEHFQFLRAQGYLCCCKEEKHRTIRPLKSDAPQSPVYAHTLYLGGGTLAERHRERLKHGLEALNFLSLPIGRGKLEAFKKSFSAKFEYHEIPVLQAIDPDLGVPYPVSEELPSSPVLSPVHRYLIRKWIGRKKGQPIAVDIGELSALGNENEGKGSEGGAVMFSVAGNEVSIKHAGGLCASALIARMTVFDPQVEELARSLCTKEQELNPHALLADVIYEGEEVMESLCAVRPLRPYHLSIGPACRSDLPGVLAWDDLFLKMQNGELVLFSRSHQKRVVPCLNHAYNYRRDRLPLYRLLADLQLGGRTSKSGFRLRDYFPGQHVYPRVTCQGTVFSHACWEMPHEWQQKIQRADRKDEKEKVFREYAEAAGLPDVFLLKQGDQGLVFHIGDKPGLGVFFREIEKRPNVTLEEWPWEQGTSSLSASGNKSYAHELLAFYFTGAPSYAPLEPSSLGQGIERREDSGWLSVKAYVQEDQQDRLLLEEVWPAVQLGKGIGHFPLWHFVRYRDPMGFHLRIRMKCSKELRAEAQGRIMALLHKWRALPYVREVVMDAYVPEVRRYRLLGMSATEKLFEASSTGAARSILGLPLDGRLNHALSVLGQLSVVMGQAPGLAVPVDRQSRIEWDRWFREHKSAGSPQLENWAPQFMEVLKGRLPYGEEDGVRDYLFSLFHMHCNRVFWERAPEYERMCHYLLPKWEAYQAAVHH